MCIVGNEVCVCMGWGGGLEYSLRYWEIVPYFALHIVTKKHSPLNLKKIKLF